MKIWKKSSQSCGNSGHNSAGWMWRRWMSGGGWWSDETVEMGVWMNPSPPPQTTASVLGITKHLGLDRTQKNLFSHQIELQQLYNN